MLDPIPDSEVGGKDELDEILKNLEIRTLKAKELSVTNISNKAVAKQRLIAWRDRAVVRELENILNDPNYETEVNGYPTHDIDKQMVADRLAQLKNKDTL